MDKLSLEELKDIIQSSTGGQWHTRFLHRLFKSARKDDELLWNTIPEQDWKDCEFIAASRTALPNALRLLEEMGKVVTEYYKDHLDSNGLEYPTALTEALSKYESFKENVLCLR